MQIYAIHHLMLMQLGLSARDVIVGFGLKSKIHLLVKYICLYLIVLYPFNTRDDKNKIKITTK